MEPRVLAGRGVWEEPFYATVQGWVTLCAVTSQHVCIEKAVVETDDQYDEELARLWLVLQQHDPVAEPTEGGGVWLVR